MKIYLILLFLAFPATLTFGQKPTPEQSSVVKPFILGEINEFYSKELKEKRILNIYLPEGYNPKDTIRYPVIYLLDGSADEDFIHIVGLVQFNSFEWVNQDPKSILVGIATVDRRRDFTFPTTVVEDKSANPSSGHSNRFMSFIEKRATEYTGEI